MGVKLPGSNVVSQLLGVTKESGFTRMSHIFTFFYKKSGQVCDQLMYHLIEYASVYLFDLMYLEKLE